MRFFILPCAAMMVLHLLTACQAFSASAPANPTPCPVNCQIDFIPSGDLTICHGKSSTVTVRVTNTGTIPASFTPTWQFPYVNSKNINGSVSPGSPSPSPTELGPEEFTEYHPTISIADQTYRGDALFHVKVTADCMPTVTKDLTVHVPNVQAIVFLQVPPTLCYGGTSQGVCAIYNAGACDETFASALLNFGTAIKASTDNPNTPIPAGGTVNLRVVLIANKGHRDSPDDQQRAGDLVGYQHVRSELLIEHGDRHRLGLHRIADRSPRWQ